MPYHGSLAARFDTGHRSGGANEDDTLIIQDWSCLLLMAFSFSPCGLAKGMAYWDNASYAEDQSGLFCCYLLQHNFDVIKGLIYYIYNIVHPLSNILKIKRVFDINLDCRHLCLLQKDRVFMLSCLPFPRLLQKERISV